MGNLQHKWLERKAQVVKMKKQLAEVLYVAWQKGGDRLVDSLISVI